MYMQVYNYYEGYSKNIYCKIYIFMVFYIGHDVIIYISCVINVCK